MSIIAPNPLHFVLTTDGTWRNFFGALKPEDWYILMQVDRCARDQIVRFREGPVFKAILTGRLDLARETNSLFVLFWQSHNVPFVFKGMLQCVSYDEMKELWSASVKNDSPVGRALLRSEKKGGFEINHSDLEKALRKAVKHNKPGIVQAIFACQKIEVNIDDLVGTSVESAKSNNQDNSQMIELFLYSCHAPKISETHLGHILGQHFENEAFHRKILELCNADDFPVNVLEWALRDISATGNLDFIEELLEFPEAKKLGPHTLSFCSVNIACRQHPNSLNAFLDFCQKNGDQMILETLWSPLCVFFGLGNASGYQPILDFSKSHGILDRVLGYALAQACKLNGDTAIQGILDYCKTDPKLLKQVLYQAFSNLYFFEVPKIFTLTSNPFIWLGMASILVIRLIKIVAMGFGSLVAICLLSSWLTEPMRNNRGSSPS